MSNINLYIFPLIILLPLFSSIISGFLGRKLGSSGVQFITCSSLILSSIFITYAFFFTLSSSSEELGGTVYINLGSWINSEYLNVNWEFMFDQLSISLGMAVIWCSTLIHIYTIDYLSSDPHIQRFFSYLSAFTAGMLILIFGGNYLVMFVGWEAIGVVSYLLINFYFTRIQANKAAILAFTMNRTGDMLLSISFFALFFLFGSLNYSTIYSLVPNVNETAISIIGFLILGGALAKSANIPLHSWLPGSMEAPTPVSALLHAATLVTAGIYLLLRSSPILEFAPTVLLTITLIGSTTAFYGATCGLLQNDLKRIIAMSTISQLGYMMMAIGLSQYNVALFHTVNHSFFKALLFLSAGSIIHSFNDQQDIRKMGGLIKFLPFVYSVMLVGTLSLMALPFLTGFYSKDLIIELSFGKYSFTGLYAYILGTLTAGITAFYSFRLISLVFFHRANGQKQSYLNSHESNISVIIPLLVLAIFSIFFGYILSDLYVGIGTDFFGNSMFFDFNNLAAGGLIESEGLSKSYSILSNYNENISGEEIKLNSNISIIKLLPSIFSLGGALLGLLFYYPGNNTVTNLSAYASIQNIFLPLNSFMKFFSNIIAFDNKESLVSEQKNNKGTINPELKNNSISEILPNNNESNMPHTGLIKYSISSHSGNANKTSILKKIYGFLNGKYYFDIVYNNYIVSKGLKFSYKISKEIDRGIIELMGPSGLSNMFLNTGYKLSKLDTGIITTYALYITLSLLVFVYFLFSSVLGKPLDTSLLLETTSQFGQEVPSSVIYSSFNNAKEVFKFVIVIFFPVTGLILSSKATKN